MKTTLSRRFIERIRGETVAEGGTELNKVFVYLLFKIRCQCLFEDRWVGRRQRRGNEKICGGKRK